MVIAKNKAIQPGKSTAIIYEPDSREYTSNCQTFQSGIHFKIYKFPQLLLSNFVILSLFPGENIEQVYIEYIYIYFFCLVFINMYHYQVKGYISLLFHTLCRCKPKPSWSSCFCLLAL